ncbi:ParB/RepB/Spo0J family partition protein [Rhodopirellula sp. JC740]|uniref:ParB/RepB/Spo0J family partition protein n=1 Tax=Rhodopirellula halodulae TaxID=2894198 RepID=A0ABS8NHZ2_9BACT|nr:ParB/RepB/Spo0J family partition protein [Rhodopirellula sp. JC740]MCC9643171.1 ParB/RepB/Spo0J family partition protein [Rhodopirellula sp. JC740]
MSRYPIHPAATLMPEMDPEEYRGLVDDIRKHGLLESIVLCDGKVIDGRHRLKACGEIGIDPPTVLLDASLHPDPVAYVLSTNLHRRHLSPSQRAMIAAETVTSGHGGNRRADQAANVPLEKTTAEAATQLSVSSRSVTTARSILKAGDQAVIDAVASGEMSLRRASRAIRESQEKTEHIDPSCNRKKLLRKAAAAMEAAMRDVDSCNHSKRLPEFDQFLQSYRATWNRLQQWARNCA